MTTFDVFDPISGACLGTLPVHSADDVRAAVERARERGAAWAALGADERARRLRAWGERLWREQAALIATIRRETGKTHGSAFLECFVIDNLIFYYAHHAPRWLAPQPRRPLFPLVQRARVHYDPHGVVGVIAPWNYPLFNAFADLIPALFAGNAVVLKPSELTPYTALFVVEHLRAAGIDAVEIVTGAAETGAALVAQADYVAFTGSTQTGRRIAVACAERLIPCSLELGGADPLIVLADADIGNAAAAALRGAMENAGQLCVGIQRCYVEAPAYDAFVSAASTLARAMTVGAGDGFGVHMGSLNHPRELARTEAHIADALAKGARLVAGGKRRLDLGALFFEPTVLADCDHTMRVMQEETFGPVLPVMRAADADAAVALANSSPFGLSGAIFTGDVRRGERLARQIVSGDVSVNRALVTIGTPSLPMGGRRQSGIGRRGGREGLLRFVTTQSVVADVLLPGSRSLTTVEPHLYRLALFVRWLSRWLPFVRV